MEDNKVIKLDHPFTYQWGEIATVKFQYCILSHYTNNGALAVILSPSKKENSDIAIVSVNTDDSDLLDSTEFVLHSTDLPEDFQQKLFDTHVAEPTKKIVHSGFVDFPVWKLGTKYAKALED